MRKTLVLMLIAVLGLSLIAAGCGSDDTGGDAVYNDGTYTGVGEGMDEIKLDVTIAKDKITAIEVIEDNETPDIGGVAFETLIQQALEIQSAEVDVVSEATITSEGFKEALADALEQAKK